MATLFGGTPYRPSNDGTMQPIPTNHGLKSFWHAFFPGGQDATDGMYANNEGNIVGSWLMRVNYDRELWRFSLYADHFFEDHSQMFLINNNGYGSGNDWNKRIHRRYFLYDLKDIMLAANWN